MAMPLPGFSLGRRMARLCRAHPCNEPLQSECNPIRRSCALADVAEVDVFGRWAGGLVEEVERG